MKLCEAITANGQRCSRFVSSSESFCYAHHPETAEARSKAASKAAKAKYAASALSTVKAQLRDLAADVLDGSVDWADASVVAQVLGVFIRACEQERRQRETEELAERLAALEQQQQGGVRWGT
jgi:flagellar motility protein MotE (MotC chaperone)